MMIPKPTAAAMMLILFLILSLTTNAFQTPSQANSTARLIEEILAHGEQMKTLQLLSDEIGSRLTGTAGARQAVEAMENEMKRLGLDNVHREAFTIPVS